MFTPLRPIGRVRPRHRELPQAQVERSVVTETTIRRPTRRIFRGLMATWMPEHLMPLTVDGHLTRITSDGVVKKIAEGTGGDLEQVRATLNIYAAECRDVSPLIVRQIQNGSRIREGGAGLGISSSYLRLLGHNIIALNPCSSGFDFSWWRLRGSSWK